MNRCYECKYFNGEHVGFVLRNVRRRCTHPKHYRQPKYSSRKACKYFIDRNQDL